MIWVRMAFHRAKTWKERGLRAQALQNKCSSILERLQLPRDDARALGIVHVGSLCSTLAELPLRLFHEAESREGAPRLMKVLGYRTVDDMEIVLKDLVLNALIAWVTTTQFALENCVESVLDAIPDEKKRGSFSKSVLRLIQVANLEDPDTKYEILMVPAWIRNSLHAVGIHNRDSKSVDIDGVQYIFEKGERVACGSWSHIFHAYDHGLDIYEEMLCSPRVKAIIRIPTKKCPC
jgi:hypothetical protein